jgi:predicted dehydrogenase
MRVAIVGLGAAAIRGHLPALEALATAGRVKIAGGCDSDQSRRRLIRSSFPQIPIFASATDMLAATRSELLVIAVEPKAHTELAALGAQHGQHILCEKPAGSTPAQVAEFAAIRERWPQRGLVAVYQYRFSRPWILAKRYLQASVRPGRCFTMSVEVERPTTDQHASSNWRDDPAMGGALADHAVHFLALARVLRGSLDVVCSERSYDSRHRERVRARLAVGPDILDVSVAYGARRRRTCIVIACGDLELRWTDSTLRLERDGHQGHPQAVPALSDRQHVDTLYLPMYLDLLAGIRHEAWRRRSADELLEVSQSLTALLTEASASEHKGDALTLAA